MSFKKIDKIKIRDFLVSGLRPSQACTWVDDEPVVHAEEWAKALDRAEAHICAAYAEIDALNKELEQGIQERLKLHEMRIGDLQEIASQKHCYMCLEEERQRIQALLDAKPPAPTQDGRVAVSLEQVLEAIEVEPELPGEMPPGFKKTFEKIPLEEALRIIVALTKSGIRGRVKKLDALPATVNEGEWRPIETAPRTGCMFAVEIYTPAADGRKWDIFSAYLEDDGDELLNLGDGSNVGWNLQDANGWQPLPHPPKGA